MWSGRLLPFVIHLLESEHEIVNQKFVLRAFKEATVPTGILFFFFFYCCDGWEYIVAFTQVLTMY
jgi:hypothetical protein